MLLQHFVDLNLRPELIYRNTSGFILFGLELYTFIITGHHKKRHFHFDSLPLSSRLGCVSLLHFFRLSGDVLSFSKCVTLIHSRSECSLSPSCRLALGAPPEFLPSVPSSLPPLSLPPPSFILILQFSVKPLSVTLVYGW